jgi:universal stress protein E
MSERTILVIVDTAAEEPQVVIDRAAWLARRAGATLELFAAEFDVDVDAGVVTTVAIPENGGKQQILARQRGRLEEFAAPLRASGLEVAVDVVWEQPVGEAVIRKIAASSPWLVAKGTHHHNVVQRTLLTNTDWQLIRSCPVPLLLVKPRQIAARPKIVAAVDPLHQHDKPAQLDDAIFRFAEGLAQSTNGELHLVHAFALPMGLELPPDVTALVAAQHREAMTAFLRGHPLPTENVHLLEGLAHECLRHVAQEEAADFVVMGAVARRGLRKLLIGSTAERVLDRLPCDLVIIKPPGFSAPANQ